MIHVICCLSEVRSPKLSISDFFPFPYKKIIIYIQERRPSIRKKKSDPRYSFLTIIIEDIMYFKKFWSLALIIGLIFSSKLNQTYIFFASFQEYFYEH